MGVDTTGKDKAFLSTPSARRATDHPGLFSRGVNISIHALREEGDSAAHPPDCRSWHFYPRPPRGGRPLAAHAVAVRPIFLSTPSARRATHYVDELYTMIAFLSTPSARRATIRSFPRFAPADDFYPRPPRGGRQ